ncbi:MAG: replication-relaxation family protein [Pseudomonadota bacterium]
MPVFIPMTALDTLGRRARLFPQSTGKRITLTERDVLWFALLHEHGPLPSSYLHERTKDRWVSEKRAKERLTDLFNEANTPHEGPYLTRPLQQFRTIDSRYNELIYDLMPAAETALRAADRWRSHNARPSGPWLHGHMVACITASIELVAMARADLTYVPGWRILERAGAELRYPVTIADPTSGRQLTKYLIPDALFGLEYHTAAGSRFRFFVVEADRATEPLTSSNWNRKCVVRSFLQYEAYVCGARYNEHLKLTAPLLVLNVCSTAARAERMRAALQKLRPGGMPYQLFQSWEGFGDVWRPQAMNRALLEGVWERVGGVGFGIDG